ncbi:polymeric immunoglobulin receptor isoform X3 [Astyanax mexicanus]|uniref:polymeric immunoglobulin receptor isoform X3 n=1 Tax=Astyanax mexicanus TaxID=7994 RepID=UPI0020CB4084|nr:polymeric immunoglobulin receptor isoform X3 [Astyanax mexicanus]
MECVYLLLVVFHFTAGCTLSGQRYREFTGLSGGSVLLPCSCSDLQSTPQRISWKAKTRTADFTEVITDDQYRDRVHLFNKDSPANLSLLISDLREEDGGDYICQTEKETRNFRLFVEGCTLSGQRYREFTGLSGGSVLLPCSCSDLQSTPQRISWKAKTRTADFTEVITDDQYRDRVHLFNKDSPANLSLLISDLREEDGGDYICQTEKETRNFRLFVEGCDLVKSGEDLEEVTGFSGESVLLPCSCSNLHSKPSTVTWKFASRESSADEEIYPNQNNQHRNRVRLTNQNSGNLTLLISDLTAEDHGHYRCSVQHDHKYIRLNIKVRETTVAPPRPHYTTTPVQTTADPKTGGQDPSKQVQHLVIGVLMVVLLLLFGVVVFICWRCRGSRDVRQSVSTGGHLGLDKKQEIQVHSVEVTYSTIAHLNITTPAHVQINTEEKTEYACIIK